MMTPACVNNPKTRRGAAMLMVLVAMIFATTLSVTFLVSQGPSTAIAENVRDHARARMIAESGLTTAIAYVRDSDDWRSEQSDGYWLADQDFEGGSFRVIFEDEDGNLGDDTDDPVTITVVGEFGGVSHRVSAKVTPGEDESGGNRLLYIAGNSTPNDRDQRTIDLIESWGYTVTAIDDSETQSNYDSAVAAADVIYISKECSSGAVAGKIDDVGLGVVVEDTYLHDSFGFTSGNSGNYTGTALDIVDDAHEITDGLSLGTLTVASQNTHLPSIGSSLASGAQVLAERSGGSNDAALVVLDTGAERMDGSSSPARRVALCFSNDSFDPDHLNAAGEDLLRRCIEWAAGESSEPDAGEPQQLVRYEFNEVPVYANLVGHWKLDETAGGGGAIVGDTFYILDSGRVDSYDSSQGQYHAQDNAGQDAIIGTNATQSNHVRVASQAEVHGRVFVGPDGNTDHVVDNQGVVTGSIDVMTYTIDIGPFDNPGGEPATVGDTVYNGQTLTWDQDTRYDHLEIKGGSTITVDGHVRVWVDDHLIVNDSDILIPDGSSLTMYVYNGIEVVNDTRINPDTSAPEKFNLTIHGPHESHRDLVISGASIVSGTLFGSDDLILEDQAQLFGRAVIHDDITIYDEAALHLDVQQKDTVVRPILRDASPTDNDGFYSVGGELNHAGAIAATALAARFDGVDDFATIPHHDAYLLDAGSVSLWFRTEDRQKTQGIFSKDAQYLDTGGHLSVVIEGGVVRTRLQSATTDWQWTSSASVDSNTWHHLVFTWGPNKMRLYMDGVEVGQPYDYIGGLGTTSGGIGNYEPIVLGANAWDSDSHLATPVHSFFEGRIDDVRLYDQALDLTQVNNIRSGNDAGATTFPGYLVEDTSGYGEALDLIVQDTDAIAWPDGGGLMFTDDTIALSNDPAAKIHDAIAATGSFTLEAVFTPDNLAQNGPARILSVSESTSSRNFTLGQDGDAYAFRLRTTDTGGNGTPDINSPDGLEVAEQHVVITANGETVNFYRNGNLEHTEDRTGSFNWDDAMPLVMGGEADDTRNWQGLLSRIAIYDRALAPSQVNNLFNDLPPGEATGSSGGFKVVWTEQP
ncbi:MAG: hypothetical protein GVY24_06785 [Planctomycetes bacterium]|jgi:hypothetical protein|nr:hypothetical protein [Planctomycetota bacterium]